MVSRRGVFAEKAHDLPRGVGTVRIGIRTAAGTTRPCVARAVDGPMLHEAPPVGARVDRTGRIPPAGLVAPADRHGRRGGGGSLRPWGGPVTHKVICVARVDGRVAVAVEKDQRNALAGARGLRRRAVLHRLEGRREVVRIAAISVRAFRGAIADKSCCFHCPGQGSPVLGTTGGIYTPLQGVRPFDPIRRSGGAYGLLARCGDSKDRSPTFKTQGVDKRCEPI